MIDECERSRRFRTQLCLWSALAAGGVSGVSYLHLDSLQAWRWAGFSTRPASMFVTLFSLLAVVVAAIVGGWSGWRVAPHLSSSPYRHRILALLASVCLAISFWIDPPSFMSNYLTDEAARTVQTAFCIMGIVHPFVLKARGMI
jgi:hypothetical protein